MCRRASLIAAGLAAVAALAGCGRLDRIRTRLQAAPTDKARSLLRDVLWRHGSLYAWVDARTIAGEVVWTDHAPGGNRTRRETWRLDPVSGRLEIDREGHTLVFNGTSRPRVEGEGRVDDLVEAAWAVGHARAVRELLPLPFSLTEPGRTIDGLAARVGPAEARRWERLLVRYDPAAGYHAGDRMTVEIRSETEQVAAAILRWSDLPWAGRLTRVEMEDWRETGGLLLARRWRFFEARDDGTRAGPARITVCLETLDVEVQKQARR